MRQLYKPMGAHMCGSCSSGADRLIYLCIYLFVSHWPGAFPGDLADCLVSPLPISASPVLGLQYVLPCLVSLQGSEDRIGVFMFVRKHFAD